MGTALDKVEGQCNSFSYSRSDSVKLGCELFCAGFFNAKVERIMEQVFMSPDMRASNSSQHFRSGLQGAIL